MSPREHELALKKQRLQRQSAALRSHLARQAQAFEPAFGAVDLARAGYVWLRDRPYIWVTAAVVAVVVRPSAVWRWIKRGVVGWQTVRQLSGLSEKLTPLYEAWRAGHIKG